MTLTPVADPAGWRVRGAHHDGSELYVSPLYPRLGQPVSLWVRVDPGLAATAVHLRSTVDGDQHFSACLPASDRSPAGSWWAVTTMMRNTRLRYRFLIDAPRGGMTLNGVGLHDREVTDVHDFCLTVDPPPPAWARDAVFYEIFLDRFARSTIRTGAGETAPEWAVLADWDDDVRHGTADGVRQLYGGDLRGVSEHLDHLEELGVTAVYLTPFFPATSNHRYDASTFGHVDPLLGGDEALVELTAAAHRRGVRIVGDLTLNHTGSTHEWFVDATADPDSPQARFYLFDEHPSHYETFAGVPSMPKLDHRSAELRARLFEGSTSVVHRYLEEFGLDGWRIDVAQSSGHCGASDRTLETARATMRTARAATRDAYVVAEHQFDASEALQGDAWHGAMAYGAFTRPVWSWLAETDIDRHWGVPAGHPPYTGVGMAAAMDQFTALIPWRSRTHSLNLLDSHDTPRLLSVTGPSRYRLAVGMLLTFPGIPMLFAGDEIGTHGVDLEDARQPFRWARETWDQELFDWHRRLIRLRRSHQALVTGGFRWLHVGDDVVVYERADREQTLIVQVSRRDHPPVVSPVPAVDLLDDRHLSAGQTLPAEEGFGVWAVRGSRAAPGA